MESEHRLFFRVKLKVKITQIRISGTKERYSFCIEIGVARSDLLAVKLAFAPLGTLTTGQTDAAMGHPIPFKVW